MGLSTIEWTDYTFNPWHGCAKVSAGCANCYAESLTKRVGTHEALDGSRTDKFWGVKAARRKMTDRYWDQPLRWNALAAKGDPRRFVFCGSMCDVFEDHADVRGERKRLWALIEETPHLVWMLLTKRPENVGLMVPLGWPAVRWPDNVWIGTSVEDQRSAGERIPRLLKVPAPVRFLSCEPLLGPVHLPLIETVDECNCAGGGIEVGGMHEPYCGTEPGIAWNRLHWVIVGGESGPGARPMHPEWARTLRDQCQAVGVPFHFKQMGEYAPVLDRPRFRDVWVFPDGTSQPWMLGDGHVRFGEGEYRGDRNAVLVRRVGKKRAGRELDGRTWDERPPAPLTQPHLAV